MRMILEVDRMKARVYDLDQFLETIHNLENTVYQLVHKSNLTDSEKKLILDHILIVPGTKKAK
jgi:hypothetical protein